MGGHHCVRLSHLSLLLLLFLLLLLLLLLLVICLNKIIKCMAHCIRTASCPTMDRWRTTKAAYRDWVPPHIKRPNISDKWINYNQGCLNYIFNSISQFLSKGWFRLRSTWVRQFAKPHSPLKCRRPDVCSQKDPWGPLSALTLFLGQVSPLRKTKWPTGFHSAALIFTIKYEVLMFSF